MVSDHERRHADHGQTRAPRRGFADPAINSQFAVNPSNSPFCRCQKVAQVPSGVLAQRLARQLPLNPLPGLHKLDEDFVQRLRSGMASHIYQALYVFRSVLTAHLPAPPFRA